MSTTTQDSRFPYTKQAPCQGSRAQRHRTLTFLTRSKHSVQHQEQIGKTSKLKHFTTIRAQGLASIEAKPICFHAPEYDRDPDGFAGRTYQRQKSIKILGRTASLWSVESVNHLVLVQFLDKSFHIFSPNRTFQSQCYASTFSNQSIHFTGITHSIQIVQFSQRLRSFILSKSLI